MKQYFTVFMMFFLSCAIVDKLWVNRSESLNSGVASRGWRLARGKWLAFLVSMPSESQINKFNLIPNPSNLTS